MPWRKEHNPDSIVDRVYASLALVTMGKSRRTATKVISYVDGQC
jgi:hypothetical protein